MPDTQSSLSLWPSEFGEIAVLTPVAILRQQGVLLGEQTQNIVIGRVTTQPTPDLAAFIHHFSLYCSPLGYQVELFYVGHGIDLYPAGINFPDERDSPPLRAEDADDFKRKLKEIFSRAKTKKIVATLLAQSRQ